MKVMLTGFLLLASGSACFAANPVKPRKIKNVAYYIDQFPHQQCAIRNLANTLIATYPDLVNNKDIRDCLLMANELPKIRNNATIFDIKKVIKKYKGTQDYLEHKLRVHLTEDYVDKPSLSRRLTKPELEYQALLTDFYYDKQ